MSNKVSIIILNWNGWKDTIECLESLYQITYPNYDVILVDNGSEDESIEKIKKYCNGKTPVESNFFKYDPSNKPIKIIEYTREEAEAGGGKEKEIADFPSNRKLRIIKNEKNYGFAEGNNIGMRYALKKNTDYVFLLNNDTVVHPTFLSELVKVAEGNPEISIVGPMECYYYEPNKIASLGARLNFWTGGFHRLGANEMDGGQYNKNREVDFVGGAALLIKRTVIKKVGMLYPPYFANWEEADWCWRVKKRGYKVVCNPKAKTWHKVARSLTFYDPWRVYLILRNNILFMRRNAKLVHLPSFLIFYFFLRVPAFALGLFRTNSIRNPLKIASLVMKAVRDSMTADIKYNFGSQARLN